MGQMAAHIHDADIEIGEGDVPPARNERLQ